MLQHFNDSKYGDTIKMIPVKKAPPLPQPKPNKRVFRDRPTVIPILNGIQSGIYHQPTKPVITPIPKDNNVRSELILNPMFREGGVNNPIDFINPA